MTTLLRNRLWFIALLICSCDFCFGQPASGVVTLNFDQNTPLIDMNGSFNPTNQVINGLGGADTPLSFSVDLSHNGRGTLKPSGTALVFLSGSPVAATVSGSGRVFGGGTSPIKVNLSLRFTGSGVVAGRNTQFRMGITYKLTFVPEDVLLEGTSRGSASFTGFGKSSINSNVAVPLPFGSDGTWSAVLDIVPLRQFGGSGTIITLPGYRTYSGNLSGNFSAGSNLSHVHMNGINEGRGISVTFNLGVNQEGAPELETMRGKILGQNVTQ